MAFNNKRVYHDDGRFGEHAGLKAQRQEDQLAMEVRLEEWRLGTVHKLVLVLRQKQLE